MAIIPGISEAHVEIVDKRISFIVVKIREMSTKTPNTKEGEIVCIRNEPRAPTEWPLAQIVKFPPGHDGKLRVVTLRTRKGMYNHPIL